MPEIKAEKSLNVGCGPASRWIPNTEGLDSTDFGQKYVANFLEWKPPYEFDVLFVHHMVEHIEDQIALFEKIGECLKVGGIVDIRVPTLPHAQAFIDPTHVKIIPEQADLYFSYFTKNSPAGHCYTKAEFEIVGFEHDRFPWEARLIMKLIKK